MARCIFESLDDMNYYDKEDEAHLKIKQQLVNLGINPIGRESLDELQAFVKTEVVRWGKVLQEAGLAGSE